MNIESVATKDHRYQSLLEEVEKILQKHHQPSQIHQRICTLLHHAIPHYTWVGLYLVEGDLLRLKAWDGPAATEHTEIEIGKGICGAAAMTGETEIIPDVNADPRYLQCFLGTRSEIVVPIKDSKQIYGEIDIDSNLRNAFSMDDAKFLELVAAKLLSVLTS